MKNLRKYGLIFFMTIIIVGVGFYLNSTKNKNTISNILAKEYKIIKSKNYRISDNLIKLEFNLLIGQGIPSILLKDSSECISKTPCNEYPPINVMPVFINKDYNLRYQGGPIRNLNERQSIEVSKVIAEKLGIDKNLYETNTYGSGYYVYFPNKKDYIIQVEANAENIRIFISNNSDKVSWKLPIIKEENEHILQEKYIDYFYKTYENLLGTNQPIFEVKYSRNFDETKTYKHKIFNQEEFIEDTIINYSLNYSDLWINTDVDSPGVGMITISYNQLGKAMKGEENSIVEKIIEDNSLEIVGYYPLISREEAIEKILKKDFVSTIDYIRDVKMEDILSVELIYYKVPVNKTIMPVYKAYIDLENALDEGYRYDIGDLKQYGIFYVPAVEAEYINVIFQ